jgi:hypothetical protein
MFLRVVDTWVAARKPRRALESICGLGARRRDEKREEPNGGADRRKSSGARLICYARVQVDSRPKLLF